jgi:hypothetical protein
VEGEKVKGEGVKGERWKGRRVEGLMGANRKDGWVEVCRGRVKGGRVKGWRKYWRVGSCHAQKERGKSRKRKKGWEKKRKEGEERNAMRGSARTHKEEDEESKTNWTCSCVAWSNSQKPGFPPAPGEHNDESVVRRELVELCDAWLANEEW